MSSPSQQPPQSSQFQGLTKLDISLLVGVATWQVPAPFINLRWMTTTNNNNETTTTNCEPPHPLRSCEDMLTKWPSINPSSDLDVKGTELIRSPRSALAVLRHGAKVRDLVDSDTHAIHALSRKMKLTRQETARRIELDRERKDRVRKEIYQDYLEICENFEREDLISAVRRFLFKNAGDHEPSSSAMKKREQSNERNEDNNNDSNNHQSRQRPASSGSRGNFSSHNYTSGRGIAADAFSRLTCSPSHEARTLLRQEEIEDVIRKRDREAQRLRKRLRIDANHRANRIVKELDLAEAMEEENDQADLGNERARQVLLGRKREVAMKNEEREERARLRKEALKQEEEAKLRELEEYAKRHDEKVSSFVSERDRRAQNAKMSSIRKENKSRLTSSTPTPKKLKMLNDALNYTNNQEREIDDDSEHQRRRPNTPSAAAGGARTPQRTNPQQQALELDDLLTEWKVQNAKTEKLHRAFELGRKREEALLQAQQRRNNLAQEREQLRKQTAKKEERRADTAANNKRKIQSRVSNSVGILAARIEHAKQYTHDRDIERGNHITQEFESRMVKSQQLLESQAQERRRKLIERIYQEDEANEWRVQRREKNELTADAKRVMFNAELEDIEEDVERKRAVQKQAERENHLLRKTNLNAFHDLADEEKRILVELGLQNAGA